MNLSWFFRLWINWMREGGEIQSHYQVPHQMDMHNMEGNKRYFMQIVLTSMLHMMYEKYGNDYKCAIQVKGEFSKRIHKPLTLYVQVEARSTTGMIQFPCKSTCIPVSHSCISDLHT